MPPKFANDVEYVRCTFSINSGCSVGPHFAFDNDAVLKTEK